MTAAQDQLAERAAAPHSHAQGVVERAFGLVGRIIVVLGAGACLYGVLTLSSFLCCGADMAVYAIPGRSPLGSVVTYLVVWPVGGALCLAAYGALGPLWRGLRKAIPAAVSAIRPHDDA